MKCGCKITYNTSGPLIGHGTIVYCPLHAAAEEMLEMLTHALIMFKSLVRNGILANPPPIQRRLERLREAISLAERKD